MKIYRFEVTKRIGGSPNNFEYEAIDELDGSVVNLLQWTPESGSHDDILVKLDEVIAAVDGVEAFSADSSLYLKVPTKQEGNAVLGQLRSSGLFLANWPGFDEPVQPPLTPDASGQKEHAQIEIPVRKAPRRTWVLLAVCAVGVLTAAIAWREKVALDQERAQANAQYQRDQQRLRVAEDQANIEKQNRQRLEAETRRKTAEADRDKKVAEERAKEMEAQAQEAEQQRKREAELAEQQHLREAELAEQQRKDQQKAIEDAMRQAEKQQREKDLKELDSKQAGESKRTPEGASVNNADYVKRQDALAATLSNQYHRIQLVNECKDGAIDVAIGYQDLNRQWVTKGWWRLYPNLPRVADSVYTLNPTFYFYAQGGGRIWGGDTANGIDLAVGENLFINVRDSLQGVNRRIVKGFRKDYTSVYGVHLMRFTCTK